MRFVRARVGQVEGSIDGRRLQRLFRTDLIYDAAGNLTNDGSHSYRYDAEGDLLNVDAGNTGDYAL